MAIFEIPTRNDIFIYQFQVELENETYTINIRYNKRIDKWVLSIPNSLNGIPLLGGQDILKIFHYLETLPSGEMKIIDLDQLGRDAQRELLSDRVVLGYKESI